METKNMAAVEIESTGRSSEIKEQYEKHEKFVGGIFFLSSRIFFISGISALFEEEVK